MSQRSPQVLILGAGIGGLSAALELARAGWRCAVVAKSELTEGATRYAQGGIASVWSKEDTFADHIRDTLVAGAGLCRQETVELCVQEGPARVSELVRLGVEFTRGENQEFDLHREGGHGKRRILHAGDLTGWEIERALVAQVRSHPNIAVWEHHTAIDLILDPDTRGPEARPNESANGRRVRGVYLLDTRSQEIRAVAATYTILATGGAGKVYLYTSNPDTATGDGIAMAYRAGARVANLEFMQFHPTCLFHPEERTFLLTEALRGEGALLKLLSGERFMPKHHPDAELAPRDVVARSIDFELKRTGDRHVWLDISHRDGDELRRHFPHIDATLRRLGIDFTREPIPVVPAMHYTCGGVLTDAWGRTTLPGLFAVGEVACTGLHGANRLASNSLLEAVVFAYRAAHEISRQGDPKHESPELELPRWQTGLAVPLEEQLDLAANWLEVRTLMWNYVGIVRSERRLQRARRRLDLIREDVDRVYWQALPTRELIELRNLVLVAELVIQSASSRKESRGLHYTLDYPERNDTLFARDTVL